MDEAAVPGGAMSLTTKRPKVGRDQSLLRPTGKASLTRPSVPAGERVKDRKGHRKSRQGCFACKQRKIKCQETFPTCENCARLSIRCQYKHTSAVLVSQSSSTPQVALNTTPNFSLTDFRLFHHYLVAAYPHFPVASEDIWLNYITPISHQSSFLMNALLGLSASHLSKISPASFTAVAQDHRFKACKGLNEALSAPLKSIEEADAVIAACHALLLQSWYMDDGLNSFLVLTRSCNVVAHQVRGQNIQALLAKEDLDSRIEVMKGRLEGTPSFSNGFIQEAQSSLNAVFPLYTKEYQRDLHGILLRNFVSLSQTPVQAYEAHASVCKYIAKISHDDFMELCDSSNTACQLLLAHLVALHLIMRPISCRERKKYTVSMYRIRMTTWIDTIYKNIDASYRGYLEWPLHVSNLHGSETLDSYILSS